MINFKSETEPNWTVSVLHKCRSLHWSVRSGDILWWWQPLAKASGKQSFDTHSFSPTPAYFLKTMFCIWCFTACSGFCSCCSQRPPLSLNILLFIQIARLAKMFVITDDFISNAALFSRTVQSRAGVASQKAWNVNTGCKSFCLNIFIYNLMLI